MSKHKEFIFNNASENTENLSEIDQVSKNHDIQLMQTQSEIETNDKEAATIRAEDLAFKVTQKNGDVEERLYFSDVDKVSGKKKVLKAEDIAFKIVKKDNLDDIGNIDEKEKAIFSVCLTIINKCVDILDKYEYISFSDKSYANFEKEYWNIINGLEEAISKYETTARKEKIKNIFRGKIYYYYNQSVTVSRAFGKPFGYPGDYILLQYLYDNKIVSKTNIGKYYDQMFLTDPLSIAVIDRVNIMSKKIGEYIISSKKSEINILNIASGSGFDLVNLIKHKYEKTVNIYCFDQELYSLLYCNNRLKDANEKINFKFFKEDIKNFFKNWNQDIKFDYIYNIGLADYLPDRILKALMQHAINLLQKNGTFVLAHKDYTKFPYQFPSWTCNWNFFHRSLNDYHNFIKENLTGFSSYDITFESDKQIIYFGEFKK
ncbi:MAG: class I SAM-dependent methyltransferase [bacterium]|nr:class I SAM-dependent methyltransferase [bacterium]